MLTAGRRNHGREAGRPPALLNLYDTVKRVRDRIAESAISAGRGPDEISTLAVTKRKSADVVRAAYDRGLRQFGENAIEEGSTMVRIGSALFGTRI